GDRIGRLDRRHFELQARRRSLPESGRRYKWYKDQPMNASHVGYYDLTAGKVPAHRALGTQNVARANRLDRAGINRSEVVNERVTQERSSEPSRPRAM